MRNEYWWQQECRYISEVTDKKGNVANFHCNPEVFVRYCEMQRDQAKRDGVFDAAEYIQQCINDLTAHKEA